MIDSACLDDIKRLRKFTTTDGYQITMIYIMEITASDMARGMWIGKSYCLAQVVAPDKTISKEVDGLTPRKCWRKIRLALAELRNPDIEKVRERIEDKTNPVRPDSMYNWGQPHSGQLGQGSTTARSSPTAVVGSLKFPNKI